MEGTAKGKISGEKLYARTGLGQRLCFPLVDAYVIYLHRLRKYRSPVG